MQSCFVTKFFKWANSYRISGRVTHPLMYICSGTKKSNGPELFILVERSMNMNYVNSEEFAVEQSFELVPQMKRLNFQPNEDTAVLVWLLLHEVSNLVQQLHVSVG